MANLQLKSGAANVSPFATWANGAATLSGAIAAMVAGDTLFVSSAHAESGAGLTVTVPGATSNISRIIGGTEGATSGLTAVASGAVIGSSNATFSVSGNFVADRITWRQDTASTAIMNIAAGSGNIQWHRDCRFELLNTTPTAAVQLGTSTGSVSSLAALQRPVFKFSATGQRIQCNYNVRIVGGSIDATGSAITGLLQVNQAGRGARVLVDDFNAVNMAASANLVTVATSGGSYVRLRRIKLPASWTGLPAAAGVVKAGDRIEMIDCSSGSTLYRLWITDHAGTVRDESTVKVTAQTRSYKLVSTADCSEAQPLLSQDYFVDLSGSSQTLSLDLCTDGVTLTDADVAIEVDYFATSGELLGTTVDDRVATSIATPANQPTSSTTWTTTGLTTPVRQSVSVTLTAGSASRAIVRLALTRPSATVYAADSVAVA